MTQESNICDFIGHKISFESLGQSGDKLPHSQEARTPQRRISDSLTLGVKDEGPKVIAGPKTSHRLKSEIVCRHATVRGLNGPSKAANKVWFLK